MEACFPELSSSKLQIQIVAHEKILLIDCVSTISKTDMSTFTGQERAQYKEVCFCGYSKALL